jgi:hypothetical protein
MRNMVEKNLNFESRKLIRLSLFNQIRYFCLWISALILSMCFPKVELQLLLISLIAGAKWIAASNSRNINIFIEERR